MKNNELKKYIDSRLKHSEIKDIANSLSKICRFNGDLPIFYSVAKHSIVLYKMAKKYKKEALFHDTPEYIMQDIILPLKHQTHCLNTEYNEAYNKVESYLFNKYDVFFPLPDYIKYLDSFLGRIEFDCFSNLNKKTIFETDITKLIITETTWREDKEAFFNIAKKELDI